MEIPTEIIELLRNIYKKNLSILDSQNSKSLEKNNDFTKLFQNYWISNERLKNIIQTIDTLNPPVNK